MPVWDVSVSLSFSTCLLGCQLLSGEGTSLNLCLIAQPPARLPGMEPCLQPYRPDVCMPAAAPAYLKTAPVSHLNAARQVAATLGQQVFRDRVQWDAAAPLGSEARYAARAAADLGLGWAWQRAIAAALRQQAQARLHTNLRCN